MKVPPGFVSAFTHAMGAFKCAANIIGTSKEIGNGLTVATLSIAQNLLTIIRSGLADDVGQWKQAVLKERIAKATTASAEAKQKLAEATKATNRAGTRKGNEALRMAALKNEQAKAAKTLAQAEAIRLKAQADRAQQIATAFAQLVAAVEKLNKEGGRVAFDAATLLEMVSGRNGECDLSSLLPHGPFPPKSAAQAEDKPPIL